MNHVLPHSFDAAKSLTSLHAKSFYFSSFPLPFKKRQAAFAVYAFCRFADDLIDVESGESEFVQKTLKERFEYLEGLLDFAYVTTSEFPTSLPTWFSAFIETIERFQIPKSYFDDLLEGFKRDLNFEGFETEEELSKYCYHVAGVVGLMMTSLFQMTTDHSKEALALGEAMQLTNIIRDVREDYLLRNRIYVPKNILIHSKITEEDFAKLASATATYDSAVKVWPAILRLIDLAHKQYNLAAQGLKYIPPDGSRFCAELMFQTYRGILLKIEKKGPVSLFDRQKLSFFQKLEKIPMAIYRQKFPQLEIYE